MYLRKIKISIIAATCLMLTALPATALEQPAVETQLEIAAIPEQPAVETQLEIANILARMNFAIDREDYNEYLTYFARNFNFDPGFGEPMSDRTSVRGFLEQNQKSGFIVGKRHVMSNLMMSRSGNRIIAQYYLSVFEREKAPAIVATAFIVDEFERENGEWRVVRHITAVDPALFNVMDKQN